MSLYRCFFKTVLSRIEPEQAHKLAGFVIKGLPLIGPIVRAVTKPDPSLAVTVLGKRFATPFGLAAGFDKNATEITGLALLGFGHVEVGTLTKLAQPGNDRPRMFRLVADQALINRMGFNNGGAAAAVPRITRARLRKNRPVIGVNIGKSRATPVVDAVADYVHSTQLLAPLADYIAVNVSSPNTPGLRGLQELDQLQPLLSAVKEQAGETPVLVKIAPDLDSEQIRGIVELAVSLQLDGIICNNTTVSREGLKTPTARVTEIGAGGLSGAPLRERSLAVLREVRAAAPADFAIISVGGVSTAEDVIERLDAGANLVQGYTAFIYQGPLWAHKINRQLVKRGWRGSAAH